MFLPAMIVSFTHFGKPLLAGYLSKGQTSLLSGAMWYLFAVHVNLHIENLTCP